ncbi:hypothetical protein ACFPN0_32140 [Kitasatospora cinereorecta]
MSADAVQAALGSTGTLTAAAGDRDDQGAGTVVHSESSGDLLMRITRAGCAAQPGGDACVRPGPHRAGRADRRGPGGGGRRVVGGGRASAAQQKVISFVKTSPAPVGAREVARGLRIKMETARGHLARAAKPGTSCAWPGACTSARPRTWR